LQLQLLQLPHAWTRSRQAYSDRQPGRIEVGEAGLFLYLSMIVA